MDLEKILIRFFRVVGREVRHEHYAHVKSKRKLYRQLVAGVGTDKLLKQFVRRENEQMFKQRVQLTQHITKSVCKNLLDVFYKVPRSNSARRVLTHKGNKRRKATNELEEMLKGFFGASSFDDYMATRYITLACGTDPNSFLGFTWDDFDENQNLIQVKPLEISSVDALDYKFENNVLQYLVFQQDHDYRIKDPVNDAFGDELLDPSKSLKNGKKYTLYTDNQIFQLKQVSEREANGASISISKEGVPTIGLNPEGLRTKYVKLAKNYYEYIEIEPHNLGMVNAIRVGYNPDLVTDGETMVNALDAIEPFLLKTIKTNSELDLVATLLALPQQIGYANDCPDLKCFEGHYDDESICKTCSGTGLKKTAPSAQDAIRIRMPKSKEEMIPLKELLTYLHPDVAIIEWQERYIDNLTEKCRRFLFNSEVFTKSQVAETATGKNLDHQNVYDTLHPFALKEAKDWVCGVKIQAGLADREKGLVVSKSYGKDFKLKTLDTLIADLSLANKIGAPTLVRHLNDDIAQIIFSEKPIEMQRYTLKELFNPFAGKSEKEIIILMASLFVSRRQKILHANYGTVFDELEIEYANKEGDGVKNFYELDRTQMRKEIYRKVDEIIAQIDIETPEPVLEE